MCILWELMLHHPFVCCCHRVQFQTKVCLSLGVNLWNEADINLPLIVLKLPLMSAEAPLHCQKKSVIKYNVWSCEKMSLNIFSLELFKCQLSLLICYEVYLFNMNLSICIVCIVALAFNILGKSTTVCCLVGIMIWECSICWPASWAQSESTQALW